MTAAAPVRATSGWLPLGAAALLASLLGAVLGAGGESLALDRLLHVDPGAGLRRAASVVTLLGAGPVLYPLLLAVALRHRQLRAGRPWWWVLLPVLALAAAQVLEGVLFVTLPRSAPEGAPGTSSFSSGHAAAAALGWGLVAQGRRGPAALPRRSAVVTGASVGLLVGASRVLLEVHWATDVLAAVALGLLLLCATCAVDARVRPSAARPRAGSGPRSSGWWWSVPAAAALLPVVLLLATPGQERLKDLLVYQGAGAVVGAGEDVYGFRTVFDMPFTYPPFAALLSEPLSRVPVGLGQALWTAASVAALVPLARVALAPVVARIGLPLTVAALLVASPVRSHLRFGQVGIFLVLLVAVDLLGAPGRRSRGLGLGVAIAVKLTPAVLLPWLLLTSRGRLRQTLLWLAAASTLGLLLLWRSSVDYLGSASRDTTRFGANDVPGNQSVRGMLLRSELADALVQPTWLALALLLAVVGTVGAVRLERDGQRLAAVGVLAALSVAVSPISWVHHLVWLALPLAALVAAGRVRTAAAWWVLLLPGLPALGADLGLPLLVDLQGLTAVAAVLLLPVLCRRQEAPEALRTGA